MSSSGTTIAKNAGAMMASQLITWAMAFVLAIYLPRYLGAEGMGAIALGTSIWLIMEVFVTFGMETHLIKSVARRPEAAGSLLSTSLVIRLGFFIIAGLLVGAYLWVLDYSSEIVITTLIIGVASVVFNIGSTAMAVLTGLEKMWFISIANIVSKGVLTLVTFLFIFLGFGLYSIVSVNILHAITSTAIVYYALYRQGFVSWGFQWGEASTMITASLPYLVTTAAIVVYQEIDNIIISMITDTRTLGWYGTSMRLFSTLMFVPVVFGTVLFPVLSRTYEGAIDQMNAIARRSIDLMFLLSVPIGFGLAVIVGPIIDFLYGDEFAPSATILLLLSFVLIFTYLNTMLSKLLIAAERTSRWNIVLIAAAIVTVPLDLVLVPWTHTVYGNGGLGGALAFLVTEFVMLIAGILLLPQHTITWRTVRTAALTVLSGLAMMQACMLVSTQNLLVVILVGAVTYSACILLLRVVPGEDVALLRSLVTDLLKRFRGKDPATNGTGN
jgi:O-antigen/teichoic acid export membrane protein